MTQVQFRKEPILYVVYLFTFNFILKDFVVNSFKLILSWHKRGAMYNFFVLAVVVLYFRRGVGQTIYRRAALFNTLENFRVINGDLIKRQRSQSLGTCTQQCLSELSCASFNFCSSSESRGFCELYKDGGDVTLSAKPGWLCGKLLDKRQFVKRKF